MIKMLCNRCTGIYKFGNNTYPRRIRRRSNLGHIFGGKKRCTSIYKFGNNTYPRRIRRRSNLGHIFWGKKRCTGIYKFGNNTYARPIRRRSNLGNIFWEKKVRLMGLEIRYVFWKNGKILDSRFRGTQLYDWPKDGYHDWCLSWISSRWMPI